MIKSFCIKTNNEQIIDYLLDHFEKLPVNNIFISICNFRIYKNIIVHYTGTEMQTFLNLISHSLSDCIVQFYEIKLLKKILYINYFYFNESEQKIILDKILTIANDDFADRTTLITDSISDYMLENKSLILDGFINFRLSDYFEELEYIVDSAINSYLIEKEYIEFINLLKIYVNSQKFITETVHLIYQHGNSILLDENLNIINLDDNIFKATYLSDISFSSNDLALNSLLNLLPRKIFIHLIDKEDEFIKSIKSIFENRVSICKDCNICNLYKNLGRSLK